MLTDTYMYIVKGQFLSSIPLQQITAVSKVMCARIKNRKYIERNYFCSIFAKICTCENNPYYGIIFKHVHVQSSYISALSLSIVCWHCSQDNVRVVSFLSVRGSYKFGPVHINHSTDTVLVISLDVLICVCVLSASLLSYVVDQFLYMYMLLTSCIGYGLVLKVSNQGSTFWHEQATCCAKVESLSTLVQQEERHHNKFACGTIHP